MDLCEMLKKIEKKYRIGNCFNEELKNIENSYQSDELLIFPKGLDRIIDEKTYNNWMIRAKEYNDKILKKYKVWKKERDEKFDELMSVKKEIREILNEEFGKDFNWYVYKSFYGEYEPIEDLIIDSIWEENEVILEFAYKWNKLKKEKEDEGKRINVDC